jgi:hypothetical protein
MEVDLQAVCRVFEDVLNGSMLREQADRWAYAVVQEEETGVVTYSPPFERERIWAGVMYLYGINTMKAPNEYLHSNDDIREAMMAILCGGGDEQAGDDSASLRAAVSQESRIGQTYSIFRAYRGDVINRRVSHETPLGHTDLAP